MARSLNTEIVFNDLAIISTRYGDRLVCKVLEGLVFFPNKFNVLSEAEVQEINAHQKISFTILKKIPCGDKFTYEVTWLFE